MNVQHSTRAFAESSQKLREAPASLSEHDVEVLDQFDRGRADRARAALHPPADVPAPVVVASTPATGDDQVLTVGHLDPILGVIGQAIKQAIAPLKAEIVELKARPVVADAGVWRDGIIYENGSIVSHGGSAWICNATHLAVGTEPDHTHFRLLVKKGRDAR